MKVETVRNVVLVLALVFFVLLFIFLPGFFGPSKIYGIILLLWSMKIFLDYLFGLTMVGPYTGLLPNKIEFRSKRLQLVLLSVAMLGLGVYFVFYL